MRKLLVGHGLQPRARFCPLFASEFNLALQKIIQSYLYSLGFRASGSAGTGAAWTSSGSPERAVRRTPS